MGGYCLYILAPNGEYCARMFVFFIEQFSSLYALYSIIQRIKSAELTSMTPNLTNLQSTKTYEVLPLCSFSEIPCPVALLSSFSSRNLPARFSPSFRPLSPSTVNCFFSVSSFQVIATSRRWVYFSCSAASLFFRSPIFSLRPKFNWTPGRG